MTIKDYFDKIKKILENPLKDRNKKIYSNIIVVFLVGILLVIVSSFFKNTKQVINTKGISSNINLDEQKSKDQKNSNTKSAAQYNYETQVEKKLKSTLENIEGVGKVQVMIYSECGEEQVPVYDTNDADNVTEESDNNGGKRKITQNNKDNKVVMKNKGEGTEPFITKTYKPKITGVCVVAEGAKDDLIKLTITKAVVDLFNLPQNKVNVYPMN